MLGGEYLGGGHQACLCAVVEGDEHAQQCDKGFAAAHVALQQSVHLLSGAHVGANLLYDALLCPCQLKWHLLRVESVEILSYSRKSESGELCVASARVTLNVELNVEQLLKFQP